MLLENVELHIRGQKKILRQNIVHSTKTILLENAKFTIKYNTKFIK